MCEVIQFPAKPACVWFEKYIGQARTFMAEGDWTIENVAFFFDQLIRERELFMSRAAVPRERIAAQHAPARKAFAEHVRGLKRKEREAKAARGLLTIRLEDLKPVLEG